MRNIEAKRDTILKQEIGVDLDDGSTEKDKDTHFMEFNKPFQDSSFLQSVSNKTTPNLSV